MQNSDNTSSKAHKAASYNQWLSAEIQEAIKDPRPSTPHNEVMTRMDANIDQYIARHEKHAS